MSDFLYLECRLGKTIGLSDSMVKSARKRFLVDGIDFRLVDGRVAYTKAAIKKLVQSMVDCDKTSDSTKDKIGSIDIRVVLAAALISPVVAEIQATQTPVVSEKKPAAITDASRLLEGPWTVPDAVLIVTRLFPRNQHILHARLDPAWIKENGYKYYHRTGIDPRQHTHRIRVTSTRKFTVGMEVPCNHKQADLWTCNCRMPRRKGSWN